jgi:hypothetical protein
MNTFRQQKNFPFSQPAPRAFPQRKKLQAADKKHLIKSLQFKKPKDSLQGR